MKKIIFCLVAVCMAAMSFVTVHCEDNIKVILDGKTLEFDVQPQIIDERTLVPMRVIFEALGADVEWEEETQTINTRRSDTDLFISVCVWVTRQFIRSRLRRTCRHQTILNLMYRR